MRTKPYERSQSGRLWRAGLIATVVSGAYCPASLQAQELSIIESNGRLFEAELEARGEADRFGKARVYDGVLRTQLYRRPKLEWALPGEIELSEGKGRKWGCSILTGFLNEEAATPFMSSMTDKARVPEGQVQAALIRFKGRMKKTYAPGNGYISNDGKVIGEFRKYVLIDEVITSRPTLISTIEVVPKCTGIYRATP